MFSNNVDLKNNNRNYKKTLHFFLRDLFQVGLDNIDITYDTVM